MTHSSDRLDRIERILEATAAQQQRTQQQLDRLTDRVDTFAAAIEHSLQETTVDVVGMITSLAHDLDALNAQVNAFIAQSNAFLASEQRDRSEFRQQMLGLQTETRNILRELAEQRRQQQGNGQG